MDQRKSQSESKRARDSKSEPEWTRERARVSQREQDVFFTMGPIDLRSKRLKTAFPMVFQGYPTRLFKGRSNISPHIDNDAKYDPT